MKANYMIMTIYFLYVICMQLMVFFIAMNDVYDKYYQCSVIKHTESACVCLL